MTHLIKSLVIALCLPILTFAGNKPDNEKLTAISDALYKAGKHNYIMVDALKDGILESGKPYSFSYKDGVITFNGKELDEPIKTAYVTKFKKMNLSAYGNEHVSITQTSTKLRLKDFVKEEGDVLVVIDRQKEQEERNAVNNKLGEVITQMFGDGLIKDPQNMSLVWRGCTLKIDGKKLTGEMAEKYLSRLEAIKGLRNSKRYSYTRTTTSSI